MTSDYCESCGAALAAAPEGTCPGCGSSRVPDAVYCEICAVDFRTGERPDSSPAGPAPHPGPASPWIVRVGADRPFFDRNQAESEDVFTFPENREPTEVPLQGEKILIGRRHETAGHFPDIDLSGPVNDPGVSRRHAVLRRQPDESWGLTDIGSTNGTWLNADSKPLEPGVLVTMADRDEIKLGLFTVLTVRRGQRATN